MGSGKLITQAIAKHGIENFRKEIIATFESSDDAFGYERELVNESFVEREDTYNLTIGGGGAWFAINTNEELRKTKKSQSCVSNER